MKIHSQNAKEGRRRQAEETEMGRAEMPGRDKNEPYKGEAGGGSKEGSEQESVPAEGRKELS